MKSKAFHELTSWTELMQWLELESYSVLCGAGVSRRAGLPLGQHFVDSFLERVILADYRALIETHLHAKAADKRQILLRFEGIIEIWKRACDPKLEILNIFAAGLPTSEHRALACLAQSHHVVTVNLDNLIEEAANGTYHLNVALNDEEFSHSSLGGLYKLHGSISSVGIGNLPQSLSAKAGYPVVTLGAVSTCMESVERREYIHELRRRKPLVVVGYSGMDDFDVCRWLFDETDCREIIWIVYSDKPSPLRVLSVTDAISDNLAPRPIWRANCHDVYNKWRIVVAHNPAELLAQLSGEPYKAELHPTTEPDWGTPSDWEKAIVTALTLQQLSRFTEAAALLRIVLFRYSLNDEQRSLTELFYAETLIPIGRKDMRLDAKHYAAQAARSVTLPDPNRLLAHFLTLQSDALLGNRSGNDLAENLDKIRLEATNLRDDELAARVTVFARQRARSHGGLAEGFGEALNGGSLLAKAIQQHEEVRNKWPSLDSADALLDLIAQMNGVIDFRFDIGQLDGACASMTVLGTMMQRYAEWNNRVSLTGYREAINVLEEVKALATASGLVWHHSQSLINLAYIFAKCEDTLKLEPIITEIESMHKDLDNADMLHISFLKVYPTVIRGHYSEAAGQYLELARYSHEKHLKRFTFAANHNASVCNAWAGISDAYPECLPLSHSDLPFWRFRFALLGSEARASHLLDLLPPSGTG